MQSYMGTYLYAIIYGYLQCVYRPIYFKCQNYTYNHNMLICTWLYMPSVKHNERIFFYSISSNYCSYFIHFLVYSLYPIILYYILSLYILTYINTCIYVYLDDNKLCCSSDHFLFEANTYFLKNMYIYLDLLFVHTLRCQSGIYIYNIYIYMNFVSRYLKICRAGIVWLNDSLKVNMVCVKKHVEKEKS